jgi:hypothetical protein
VGELHEVLGPHGDVGAGVEQQERRAGHRHQHGERRRWIPRARLISKRPAASAAPVEPPETSASARPSATARTAWTIEASGSPRTARTGPRLGDRDRRVDDLDALGRLDLAGRAEQQHAHAVLRAASGAARDLGGTEIGPVRVDRDGDRAGERASGRGRGRAVATTSRPP